MEAEPTRSDDEDFSCGLLLRDIEEISKALYLHKSPHKAFNSSHDHRHHVAARTGISESRSNVIVQDSSRKDKKSSMWSWKPLKALAHIRNHRFNCCFFLHVHSIEGLLPNFNNLNLRVTWKRKTGMLTTRPARVCLGMAEFEETLMYRCTVYGSRSGPHHSAKYEPKLFLLHASVIEAPMLDIGNHWIDLTRLLPLTMEELERDKSSSGKWTTSFKLAGKAKDAMLNVSFGFSILDGNSFEPGYFIKVSDILKEGGLNHFADFDSSTKTSLFHNHDSSVPNISTKGPYHHSQSGNVKFPEEMFPDQGSKLSHSVTLLCSKLDEGKIRSLTEFDLNHKHLDSPKLKSYPSPEFEGGKTGHEFSDTEFDVIDQGIEASIKDQMKIEKCDSKRIDSSVIETIDVAEIFKGQETAFDEYLEWNSKLDKNNHDEHIYATDYPEDKDKGTCISEPAFEELNSSFFDMLTSKSAELDPLLDISKYYEQEKYMKSNSSYNAERSTKSFSLDNVAESIEDDFLNMLSFDQSQDDIVSLEEDNLVRGNPILDTDLLAEQKESCCFSGSSYRELAFEDDFDLSCAILGVESDRGSLNQSFTSKRNAKMLENLETEALMHEWGLNENAFQYSPHASSGGFGSPVYIPSEEPLKLPSIEEGVGPIIRTKDGGLLRSMNPLLFRNANNGARLVVQVSAPVVLPSAMGLTVMEMLQRWASGGVEKMCFQANELMPLEDVTGKTMQQVLTEAESQTDALNRYAESDGKRPAEYVQFAQSSDTLYSCPNSDQIELDYVSFEDLVPMAITNIEGLLVEGLKIQSGIPDQEAPSSIRIKLTGNSDSLGKTQELSSSFGTESSSGLQVLDIDELVKYTLSLKEWMRLDSGEFYVEYESDENMMKLFAVHCAKPVKLCNGRCDIFLNNFKMGLKVQLRDPLRNYEMVGSSMLALIQVDRVYRGPQPELHRPENGKNGHMILEGMDFEQNKRKIYEPLFKVSEAHLVGLKVVHGNKQLWGTGRQQQSGSRWLHSSGMAKSNKNVISNSSAIVKSSSGLMRMACSEDVLWSISSPIQGEAAAWDERVALNVHVRNPDIVFPTESVK